MSIDTTLARLKVTRVARGLPAAGPIYGEISGELVRTVQTGGVRLAVAVPFRPPSPKPVA